MTARLKDTYLKNILPELRKEKNYKNIHQVPRLEKVVLNLAVDTRQDRNKEVLQSLVDEMGQITGQRPVVTRARISVSNFKLRQGMSIGAKVTLRGALMYEFLDRFINVALPRIRDFRGVSGKSFDGRGNFSMGITDQSIFPEINPEKIKKTQGMDIVIVTTAKTNEEGMELLKKFGMPFATA